MGILKALVELHQVPNIKLNLKFEVEVLCKALNQDLNELIGKSNYLNDEILRHRVLADPQIGGGAGRAVTNQLLPSSAPFNSLQPVREMQASGPSLMSAGGVDGFPDFRPSQASPNAFATPGLPSMIPQPGLHAFNYHDIQTTSAGLAQHVQLPANLAIWQLQPNLKQVVRPAIERAIQEWLQPVIERSIKISIPTAEQIIKKDFALEADENKMCAAAHYLIRTLTAGMSMITSKETLFIAMNTSLVAAFSRACPTLPKEQIEAAANAVASENIDLACCFIQKSAVEKAIPELDKRLASEYELRRKARAEGRRYCDTNTLTYQAERMPEPIRLKVGSVTAQQFAIYEDIGRSIPGFVSPVNDPPPSMSAPMPGIGNHNLAGVLSRQQQQMPAGHSFVGDSPQTPQSAQDAGLVNLYDKLVAELEQLMSIFMSSNQPPVLINTMHQILETVVTARSSGPRDVVQSLGLIQRVLEALNELIISVDTNVVDIQLVTRARDLYLVILKALADPRALGQMWTTKQITRLILEKLMVNAQPGSSPLPDDLFDILMRSGLINLPLVDVNVAQLVEAQNPLAVAFALQLAKIYVPIGLHETEIQNILTALIKVSKNHAPSSQLAIEVTNVIDLFRGPVAPGEIAPSTAFLVPPSAGRPSDFEQGDPPEFMEKTERLLRDWITMYHSNNNLSKVFQIYVQSMNLQGILKTDDSITRFFRMSTELCVEFCYKVLATNPSPSATAVVEIRNKCFQTIDAFAHLIVMLIKHSGTNTGVATESTAKLNLLNKVLNIIANVAIQDQENRGENFQHLPYYRTFIVLFMELTLGPNYLALPPVNVAAFNQQQLDPLHESIQFQVLSAFCQTLRVLRPSKAPSFAYAWLDFISHRTFMEKCLFVGSLGSGTVAKGWPLYAQLLIEIIKFLAPFLRTVELSSAIDLLYKVRVECV